jgi:hypothetical protein
MSGDPIVFLTYRVLAAVDDQKGEGHKSLCSLSLQPRNVQCSFCYTQFLLHELCNVDKNHSVFNMCLFLFILDLKTTHSGSHHNLRS